MSLTDYMSSKIDSKGNGKNEARGEKIFDHSVVVLWMKRKRIKEEKETWK